MVLYSLAEKGDKQAVLKQEWPAWELNWQDAKGNSALMRAAIRGDYEMASLLRECGANLDMKNADGRKAVDLAALHGHSNVLVCLMRGGCGG